MVTRVNRRTFLRGASVAALGVILGACAPQPAATPAPKQEAPTPAPQGGGATPAAKEPVTIQLHMRSGGDKSEPAIYVMRPEEFMKEHPEIKVELAPIAGDEYETKVQTMAAAKTLGDVMWSTMVFGYQMRLMKQNVTMPIDDYLAKYNKLKTEWVPAAVDALTFEGKMRGLPKCCHPSVSMVWINNDMFKEAGLQVPTAYDHTHADFMDWATKLAKGSESDRSVYGMSFGGTTFEYIYSGVRSFGGWEYNKDGTQSMADSPEWYEWAKWVNQCFKTKVIPIVETLGTEGEQGLFAAKKIAMVYGGRWMHNRIVTATKAANNPFEWSIIQAPRESNANGWISCVDTHSATTQSKHPEEAFLLSYAMADQRFGQLVMENQGYVTARVDDIETIKKLNKPILDIQYKNITMENVLIQPSNTRGAEVQTTLNNEVQKIWQGNVQLSPDAMKAIKGAVDEILKKPF